MDKDRMIYLLSLMLIMMGLFLSKIFNKVWAIKFILLNIFIFVKMKLNLNIFDVKICIVKANVLILVFIVIII